jgi:hypothetical protein
MHHKQKSILFYLAAKALIKVLVAFPLEVVQNLDLPMLLTMELHLEQILNRNINNSNS